MQIRKAILSDAQALAKLYLQFWEPHAGCDPLLELVKPPSLDLQIKQAKKDIRARNTHIFVADKTGKIVGFIELLIKKNDPIFKVRKYGYVNSCVVDKKHRGSGIARKLLLFGLDFFRQKELTFSKLNVYCTNAAAIRTWEKLGFKEISMNMLRKP